MKTKINNTKAVLIIIMALLVTGLPACSQSKYAYQQVYVYNQSVFPGNIRADKNGRPARPNIDTATFVYIETKGNTLPAWDIAWKKRTAYSITLVPVTGDSVVVGRQATTMQQVVIKPQKGNSLWRVQFNGAVARTISPKPSVNDSTSQIVLVGYRTNKKIYLPSGNIIQLAPQRRP